jgi:glycosyltransferase domain-containing protein
MNQSNLTLIVPTYNRNSLLQRLLCFLDNKIAQTELIILDSSSPNIALENAKLTRRFSHAEYRLYPSDTAPFDKFLDGVQRVNTDYVMFLADDDLILPSTLSRLISHLDTTPHAACAHGWSFDFTTTNTLINITSAVSPGAHIVGASEAERVELFIRNYSALTYSMHRTDTARFSLETAASSESIMMKELMAGAATVASGEAHCLPFLSHGRAIGRSHHYQDWHPLERLYSDPEALFVEYGKHREALISLLMKSSSVSPELTDLKLRLDLAHLDYLAPYIDTEVGKRAAELKTTDKAKHIEEIWRIWTERHTSPGPLGLNRSRKLKYLREHNPVMFASMRQCHHWLTGTTFRGRSTVRLSNAFRNQVRETTTKDQRTIEDFAHELTDY